MKQNEDYAILRVFFDVFHATKTSTDFVNILYKMLSKHFEKETPVCNQLLS